MSNISVFESLEMPFDWDQKQHEKEEPIKTTISTIEEEIVTKNFQIV